MDQDLAGPSTWAATRPVGSKTVASSRQVLDTT